MSLKSTEISHSHEETKALAGALTKELKPPWVVALFGDLGSGKTTFVQGFISALAGGDKARVKSPTFALHHAYQTSPPAHHLDLYRLKNEVEIEGLGFMELFNDQEALILVEWPDIIAHRLPARTLRILFSEHEDGSRSLQFVWPKKY